MNEGRFVYLIFYQILSILKNILLGPAQDKQIYFYMPSVRHPKQSRDDIEKYNYVLHHIFESLTQQTLTLFRVHIVKIFYTKF